MKNRSGFYKFLSFIQDNIYYFKKIGIAILTLASSVIVIFFILRLIPGDVIYEYARGLAARRGISFEEAQRLAVQLLDYDPNENIFMQFFRYVGGLFKGNLGQSLYNDEINANMLIGQRLPWTIFITSVALLLSFVIGILMGTFMASKRKSVASQLLNGYITVTSSVPDYLIGLLLVLVFAFQLKWFPYSGNYDITVATPGFNIPFILDVIHHAALPILSFTIVQIGGWALLMKGNATSILGDDYINAAKARGVKDSHIRRRYLMRNAMLPLITSLSLSFGALFGGSTLIESIFNYPGLGMELASRIGLKDFFVVQGLMFFTSAMVIIINLITDLIYPLIDPRIKRGTS